MEFQIKMVRIRTLQRFTFSLFFLACISVQAQTWNELFKQKKTQQKYLVEQLAALKIYAGYLEKGYTVVRDGIGTVRDISKGEFSLHQDFITSLSTISPAVRRNSQVVAVLSMQADIIQTFSHLGDSNGLLATERNYTSQVKKKVLTDVARDVEELLLLLTTSGYQLRDEERLERLNALYTQVADTYRFTGSFASQVRLLGVQRENESKAINQIREVYGKD